MADGDTKSVRRTKAILVSLIVILSLVVVWLYVTRTQAENRADAAAAEATLWACDFAFMRDWERAEDLPEVDKWDPDNMFYFSDRLMQVADLGGSTDSVLEAMSAITQYQLAYEEEYNNEVAASLTEGRPFDVTRLNSEAWSEKRPAMDDACMNLAEATKSLRPPFQSGP